MKKQLSRKTKRSRPVSSKVQTNRRPTKVGSRRRSGSTALASKSNGVQQTSPTTARSDKRVKPRLNENRANKDYAARIDQTASKEDLFDRPETKKQDLMRREEAIGSVKSANGAGGTDLTNRSFNRTWLDWSNATVAANLRTTEQLMRLPMDLLAISSRFASRSWFDPFAPASSCSVMAGTGVSK
jgi:hypothetical protein